MLIILIVNNLFVIFKTAFDILGGLVIFLFAMQLLGSALQTVVGEKIESWLQKLTHRPASGMIVGAVVTFLTQSSSITVLTLIGLVNVGVLNLSQGMGILLGAEIGTTITAQLVTLDIGKLYFLIITLGFVLFKLVNNKNYNSWGKVIFSFGLLFMGMELMKTGAKPIANSPQASLLFENFAQIPILGVLAGAIFSALTSSSSATTSLVVALGTSNSINLPAAIALILGANIGTTVLEFLAVLNMSLTAKRIAMAQGLINILGVLVMLPFVNLFARLIMLSSPNLARQIANAHTVFNIASSMIFLMLVPVLVFLVKKLVPGKVVKLERGVKFLDPHILKMPHLAFLHTQKEINRMGQIVIRIFNDIDQILASNKVNQAELAYAREDQIDFLYEQISDYLIRLSELEISQDLSQKVTQLTHGVADIERSADHLNKVVESLVVLFKKKKLNNHQKRLIIKFSQICLSLYQKALQSFIKNDLDLAHQIKSQMQFLNSQRKKLAAILPNSKNHKNNFYFRIIYNLERAAHHGENLADIVIGGF